MSPCAVCGQPHAPNAACAAPARSGSTNAFPVSAPEPSDPLIGQALGSFRIVRRLGSGGMGVVYLGEHSVIGSKVAVKMLHPHLAADPLLVERFMAEARAVNLIRHDNIVSIFDLNRLPPDRYYLVMEYLEGRTAASMVGSPVEERLLVKILVQVCRALDAAHSAGVVHRDLKPENVFLVRRSGTDDFVKLVDFGIAKLQSHVGQGMTMAGMVVGTPEYMPPEQWSAETVDGRTDLYALGVMAYQLLTGRLPFLGRDIYTLYREHLEVAPPPPRSLNPRVSPAVEAAVLKALAKRREDRFQRAEAMAQALEQALANPSKRAQSAAPAPVGLSGRASWRGAPPREVKVNELSRGGAYLVAAAPFPPMFEKVSLVIEHRGQRVACTGEVVRHVSREQALAWRMPEGFAVQFSEPSLSLRAAIEDLSKGRSAEAQNSERPDSAEVEKFLAGWRKRTSTDPYALLGVSADLECSEIRSCGRKAIAALENLATKMSKRQRDEADGVLERIHAAMTVLCTPGWRADYDASRSNFRGVARCLQAGLDLTELDALRRNFLASHGGADSAAKIHSRTAEAFVSSGDVAKALAEYEVALRLDPLSLSLQQRYWSLMRSRGTPAPR